MTRRKFIVKARDSGPAEGNCQSGKKKMRTVSRQQLSTLTAAFERSISYMVCLKIQLEQH
jgi:hypothetical protein